MKAKAAVFILICSVQVFGIFESCKADISDEYGTYQYVQFPNLRMNCFLFAIVLTRIRIRIHLPSPDLDPQH